MSSMTRRGALAGGAGLAALTALPVPLVQAAPAPAQALVDALDHPASARTVGLEVLSAEPGLSRDALVAELARAAGLAADRLPTIDRPLLRFRLDAARAGEFRRGDTVRVQGWVLAATEARLCALAALL
jgi:hypothetical protein